MDNSIKDFCDSGSIRLTDNDTISGEAEKKKGIDLYLFGDSIMRGVVFENKEYKTRSNFKKEEIEKRFNVKIFNNSRFGSTIERGFDYIMKKLFPESRKSYALIEYGGNDCDYNWAEVSAEPNGVHLPKTSPEKFYETYSGIIDTVRSRNVIPVVTTLPPIDAHRYLDRISRNLSRDNILHWLGDESVIYRTQEIYSTITEDIARDKKCSIIDFRRAFLYRHDFSELLGEDGIHPTEKGYEIIDAELEKFLKAVS